MLSIAPKDKGAPQPEKKSDAAPAAAAGASAAPADGENRKSSRRTAASMPQITGLRISPHGVEAALIDISETGLLAECSERLKPGSAVTAVFEGTMVPNSAEGRVARSTVWSVGRDGRLRYHVGIAFTKPFPLGEAPETATQTAAAAAPATEAPAAQNAVAAPSSAPAAAAVPTPPAAAAAPHTPAFAGRTPAQMPVISRKPSESVPLGPTPAPSRVAPAPSATTAAAPRVVRNRW
jgi:2-oxoglutarate dehydrogenase E2 component (dihydrolipoamide succinyltransferase)